MPLTCENPDLAKLIPDRLYQDEDLRRIEAALREHDTLRFTRLPTGLFSASSAGASIASSGYGNVWVRDNVFVAHAHVVNAQPAVAREIARALLSFFDKSRGRFDRIISGKIDPQKEVRERPQVRFEGTRLEEIPNQRWPQAQNDALGYFVWLYAQLAQADVVQLDEQAVAVLSRFVRYFKAIRFWEDEDNGHWEEVRKVSASSIGTVVAGLRRLLDLVRIHPDAFDGQILTLAAELVERGQSALQQILPNECVQLSPSQNRRYDAALLFLLFPLQIVDGPLAELIVHDVTRFLQGATGIRRYLRDSYWAPDYDERLSPEERTRDFSEDMATRDRLLERIGDEAQWCLFDPILSAYYGGRFRSSRQVSDLEQQTLHFNRALAQITKAWVCPELYYLRHGSYVPNPHAPLQWTQANLVLALAAMRESLADTAASTQGGR